MADYVADPQILDPNTIVLFGNYYKIAGPVQVVMSSQFPGKLVIGDYGKNDNALLSTYSVSDLTGGMGLWRYNPQEGSSNKFWNGENIDCLFPGAITLGPLMTALAAPSTASTDTLNMVYVSPSGALGATWDEELYYVSTYPSTWTLADTLPGAPVNRPVFYNNRVFYPLGSSGYSYGTSVAAVATDVADPDVVSFVVYDNKLYAVDDTGILYVSTSGDSGSWTTLATVPDPVPILIPMYNLLLNRDPNGALAIWCLSHTGAWIYDAVANAWVKLYADFPTLSVKSYVNTAGSGSALLGGPMGESVLHFREGTRAYKLDLGNGNLLIEDMSLGHPHGTPPEFVGQFYAMQANVQHTYATFGNGVGSGTTEHLALLLHNGRGWHPIYVNPGSGGTRYRCPRALSLGTRNITVGVGPPIGQYQLYFGDDNGSTDGILQYFNPLFLTESPLFSTNRTYATSGYLELPYFDGGYEAQDKVALHCRIKLLGASASETVQIAYRINGSTGSYTNLGQPVSVNTEQQIQFGTNKVGLAFKSIQFKLSFARGSTTTNAPKMEYFTMDFQRIPEVLRGFQVTIDCTDDVNALSPGEQIDNIWAAIASSTLGTFSYKDDVGGFRSYRVRVLSPTGTEFTGNDDRGKYTLFLAEMCNPTELDVLYESVKTILGSTGVILPIGDTNFDAGSVTTFRAISDTSANQAVFTWTEAPNGFTTPSPAGTLGPASVPFVTLTGTDTSADAEWAETPDATFWSRGNGTSDSAFSIGFWVRVNTSQNGSALSKSTRNLDGVSEWDVLIGDTRLLTLTCRDSSVPINVSRVSNAAIAAEGTWAFVVITYAGTGGATAMNGVTMYVNGASFASTASNQATYVAMENGTETVKFGARDSDDSFPVQASFMGGPLGPFYTQIELTAAQVLSLYNLGKIALGF